MIGAVWHVPRPRRSSLAQNSASLSKRNGHPTAAPTSLVQVSISTASRVHMLARTEKPGQGKLTKIEYGHAEKGFFVMFYVVEYA